MKIPNSIKIGGVTFEVVFTDNLENGRALYSGECDFKQHQIRILPGVCDDRAKMIFLHEMVHAMFFHFGRRDDSEELVDQIANTLFMIIKDNPGIFSTDEDKPIGIVNIKNIL